MFEKIVLRRSDAGPALSAGEVAEAMLFYQNVHLFLDYGSIHGLLDQLGLPTFLKLIERPGVTAVYCEQMLVTATEHFGKYGTHSFEAATFAGSKETGALKRPEDRLAHIISRKGYSRRDAQKFVSQFLRKVPIRDLTGNHFITGGVIGVAMKNLGDSEFVHEAVKRVVEDIAGDDLSLGKFDFEVYIEGKKFRIYTDLDFERLSTLDKARDPNAGAFTEGRLMNAVLNASGDTILAAHYGGDFYTSFVTSQIVRVRHNELLRRAGIDQRELREFREIVVPNIPSVRDVINSKMRSFDELLELVDKSDRFRQWTRELNPDEKMVDRYLRDVTSQPWISGFPAKSFRYAIGSIVGAIEPLTGLALSAGDSFLLDKMLGGWRPSHFVERQLKPFVSSDR